MRRCIVCVFCVLLSIAMVFATGCNSPAKENDNSNDSDAGDSFDNDAGFTEKTITIDGFRLVKTRAGEGVIIIEYTFTNTWDGTTAFAYCINCDASQNGIVLGDTTNHPLEEGANYFSNAHTRIKPGVTIKVEKAYLLNDTESDVLVEITSNSSENYKVSKTFRIK